MPPKRKSSTKSKKTDAVKDDNQSCQKKDQVAAQQFPICPLFEAKNSNDGDDDGDVPVLQQQRPSFVSMQDLSRSPWLSGGNDAARQQPPQQQQQQQQNFLTAAVVRQIASEVDPALALDAEACDHILNFVDDHLRRVLVSSVKTAKRRSREIGEKLAKEQDSMQQRHAMIERQEQQQQQQPVVVLTVEDVTQASAKAMPALHAD